jgi:hypothetical protein
MIATVDFVKKPPVKINFYGQFSLKPAIRNIFKLFFFEFFKLSRMKKSSK